MSNPTPAVVITDNLAQFLSRTNAYGETNQQLIQQKKNKDPGDGTAGSLGRGFPATASRSRGVAQWANMVDDFIMAFFASEVGSAATGGVGGGLDPGNSGADNATALQALLDAGGYVLLPSGTFPIEGTLDVSSNTTIVGRGTCFQKPASDNVPLFDLDGVDNVTFRGVCVLGGATPGASSRAWLVRGASTRIEFFQCEAYACGSGFEVRGEDGTVPGISEEIYFSHCISNDHVQTYGFAVASCDFVNFLHCTANNNYLDGFKLRVLGRGAVVKQCVGKFNGQSPSSAGDGIDCYAAGDEFVLDGCTFDDNLGNGVVIKTDINTRDNPSTFGYQRNGQISNLICRNNLNFGIGIYTNTQSLNNYYDNDPAFDTATLPMPKWFTVDGCYLAFNGTQGFYFNGLGISARGIISRRNGEEGGVVGLRSLWTTLTDCIFVANNTSQTGGTVPELYVRGAHIRVIRPQFFGVDPDIIRTEADIIGTQDASSNITMGGLNCDDVEVIDPLECPVSAGGILTGLTSGHCVIKQRGTGSPVGVAWGGPGSEWVQTDGVDGEVLWVKTEGAPNAPSVGWGIWGPGARSLAPAASDDLVRGSSTSTLTGSYWAALTSAYWLAGDSPPAISGGWEYSMGSNTLFAWASGAQQLRINAAAIFPDDPDGLDSGSLANPWRRTWSTSIAGNYSTGSVALDEDFYRECGNGDAIGVPVASGRAGVIYCVRNTDYDGEATLVRSGSDVFFGDISNGLVSNPTSVDVRAGETVLIVSNGVDGWNVHRIGQVPTLNTQTPTGTTVTVDFSVSPMQGVDLNSATGDVTLSVTGGRHGEKYEIVIIQGATPRQIVWDNSITWLGGLDPALNTTDDAIHRVWLTFDDVTGTYLGTFEDTTGGDIGAGNALTWGSQTQSRAILDGTEDGHVLAWDQTTDQAWIIPTQARIYSNGSARFLGLEVKQTGVTAPGIVYLGDDGDSAGSGVYFLDDGTARHGLYVGDTGDLDEGRWLYDRNDSQWEGWADNVQLLNLDNVNGLTIFQRLFQVSATTGITASTTQAQGQQPLVRTVNEISTVANSGDTVTAPAAVAGRLLIVINNGASLMRVYPASGDDLGAGVNTFRTIGTGTIDVYMAYDSTNWVRLIAGAAG